MPKNAPAKTKTKSEKKATKNSIWDIFKFGESYTSLVLGIIVVVVATLLLLLFVKARNNSNISEIAKQTKEQNTPTPVISGPESTKTQNLLTPEQKNTTITVTKPVVKPTAAKEKAVNTKNNQTISGTAYTVKEGDTLWSIAEKKYNSGYNWVDIQKANNIKNSDVLFAGTKLKLPNVAPKVATIEEQNTGKNQISSIQTNKISGTNYIIAKGDTLWDIAIRAYGDGYAWTKISKANKLSNPDIIHSGNKLTIPRG